MKRYDCVLERGIDPMGLGREDFASMQEDSEGTWIELGAYQSLQSALEEALNSWEASKENVMPEYKKKRITELRKLLER